MAGLARWLGVVGLVLTPSLALAPHLALAHGHGGSPDSTFQKVYLDSDRCRVLTQQYQRSADRGMIVPAVAKRAARGIDLCQASDYANGADKLAKAIQMLGETPAMPPGRLLLR